MKSCSRERTRRAAPPRVSSHAAEGVAGRPEAAAALPTLDAAGSAAAARPLPGPPAPPAAARGGGRRLTAVELTAGFVSDSSNPG